MKKYSVLTALVFSLCLGNAMAQQSDLSSIIPSSAPAFTILGTSPTEISKPNNWNALEAQLMQNFVSNNQATIPNNFSLEFSPYWLSNHPKFTYDDYLKSSGFSLRNLKISLATSKVPYGADSVQAMSFGFRIPIQTSSKKALDGAKSLTATIKAAQAATTAWQIKFEVYVNSFGKGIAATTVKDFISKIDQNLASPPAAQAWWTANKTDIQALMTDTIKKVFTPRDTETFSADKTEMLKCIVAYFNARNQSIAAGVTKEIAAKLKDVAPWEISGALSLVFPTSQFNYSKLGKFGIWSDYTFEVTQNGSWEGTVALRYVHSWAVDTTGPGNAGDLLGRLSWNIGDKQKFSLSAWGLVRLQSASAKSIVVNGLKYYNLNSSWDSKYGVDISYKVTDNVAFAYSFGKGYGADPFSVKKLQNELINFLSLYYSINTKVSKSGTDYLIKSL